MRRDNVRLFATPAINLFEKITDRIMVDHRNHEFHIVPDRVHVLLGGRIVRSGGRELALELEESGYGAFGHAPAQAVA